MAVAMETHPVTDSVPKVDNAVAVGEDLKFQQRWWRFEHLAWGFFALVLIADAVGCFGRGPVAKVERRTPDQSLRVRYERIERASTPSLMTIHFGPSAVRNGEVRLFVSDTILQELGAQRVIPQPAASIVGEGGVTYSFPVSAGMQTMQIALSPSFPGVHRFVMRVPGADAITGRIAVVP